jgi:hypothetical protein
MTLRPTHPGKRLVHLLQIETFRPKAIPRPLPIMIEVLMPRIKNDLKKLVVSPDATHILRRATSITAEAEHRNRFSDQNSFENDFVFPTITEIVLVNQSLAWRFQNTMKGRFPFVHDLDVVVLIPLGIAPDLPLLFKLMQMTVRPQERRLKGIVEAAERHCVRDLEASPDRWLNPDEGGLQFVCNGGVRHEFIF